MQHSEYLVRNTAQKKGHNIVISPKNTALKYLSCGRIILDKEVPRISTKSANQEIVLICINGKGKVSVAQREFKLKKFDSIYIPTQNVFEVSTNNFFDLAVAMAPTDRVWNIQYISFDSVKNNPELHIFTGNDTYQRDIYKLIDINVSASRLLCGITLGKPGNWTSWSPHEHSKSKEEVYLYIDMPKPAFGIQLVYDNLQNMDFIAPVFENDAVIITHGYHPNLGIPGYGINFVWMMAALRVDVDRNWTDMHFQKSFAGK